MTSSFKVKLGAWLALTVISILAIGCQAGRILNNTYINEEKGFRIALLPQGWVMDKQEGFDLFFHNPGTGGVVGVASQCQRGTRAPLEVLTRHLLFGIRGREVISSREIRLGEVTALQTTMEAKDKDGVVRMSLVVIKKGRCIYDLLYVSRPDFFSPGLRDFEEFVRSFSLL